MGNAYASLGINDKARAAYNRAMEVDPVERDIAEEALKELEKPLAAE